MVDSHTYMHASNARNNKTMNIIDERRIDEQVWKRERKKGERERKGKGREREIIVLESGLNRRCLRRER